MVVDLSSSSLFKSNSLLSSAVVASKCKTWEIKGSCL